MHEPAFTGGTDLLQVEGLTVRYGAGPVVHGIGLAVPDGTVAALLGANGAGKSSTLRAIAGLEPAQGRLHFAGHDITRLSAAQRFRAGIVYVPEGRAIVSDLSVEENLTLGGYFVDAATRAQRQRMVLDFFPEIANRLRAPAGLLSGGEQQMLAIGRGLMSGPRLLLLDEPSFGLAPLVVRDIFGILRRINAEQGTTILLVEQNARLALELAHSAYLLETGRIVLHGPSEAMRRNDAVRQAYLGE